MKNKLLPLAVASVVFFSCNNSASDSVAKADSANNAKPDSATMKTDSSVTVQPSIKTDDTTSMFLVKAADGGVAEVKLAQLAKEKSKDSIILNFADMMIADHGAANTKENHWQQNATLLYQPNQAMQSRKKWMT